MANTLGVYDPIFYAQEALIWLEKALGMAGRVHRGYDETPQDKGSVIQIRRPMTFTAAAMPAANTDLAPDTVSITLNQWQGVVFSLTDKELAHTKEIIIQEHIVPAAYAVADAIDQTLVLLYKDVPWFVDNDGTTPIKDFTNTWQALFDHFVPQTDLHFMLNGAQTNVYLQQTAFSQWQGAGDVGVSTQQRGTLGTKFGMETFSNQNVRTHATTAITAITQLQLNANAAKGDTTVVLKDTDAVLAGTIAKGDTFVIAGSTQRFAATADATAASNLITVAITPALDIAHLANDNVTLRQANGKAENLAFHRGAFALAMAPLSDLGNQLGAKIAAVSDPVTNLSIRSRMWYDGTNAKVYVGLDALWGVKTLNSNLAVRMNS